MTKTKEAVTVFVLDVPAMRLLLGEDARYKGLGPGYVRAPQEEQTNGNRYSVTLQDKDGEPCYLVIIEKNAFMHALDGSSIEVIKHHIPVSMKGIELRVVEQI